MSLIVYFSPLGLDPSNLMGAKALSASTALPSNEDSDTKYHYLRPFWLVWPNEPDQPDPTQPEFGPWGPNPTQLNPNLDPGGQTRPKIGFK